MRKICLLTGLNKMVDLMTDTLKKFRSSSKNMILTQRKTSQNTQQDMNIIHW